MKQKKSLKKPERKKLPTAWRANKGKMKCDIQKFRTALPAWQPALLAKEGSTQPHEKPPFLRAGPCDSHTCARRHFPKHKNYNRKRERSIRCEEGRRAKDQGPETGRGPTQGPEVFPQC